MRATENEVHSPPYSRREGMRLMVFLPDIAPRILLGSQQRYITGCFRESHHKCLNRVRLSFHRIRIAVALLTVASECRLDSFHSTDI